ncbi:MAG: hypothetical protein GY805_37480 [Chloroflexi bacterium]|nr:hypothetical protein [Chloroflexota bacterium]
MPDSVTNVPHSASGQALFAEFRTLPGGQLTLVQLGEVPHLIEELEVEITETAWDVKQKRIFLSVTVHNPLSGDVYLHSEFIQIINEGGGNDGESGQVTPRLPGQVTPRLPLLINPGETVGITVSFLPQDTPVQLQIEADLWEISSLPTIP